MGIYVLLIPRCGVTEPHLGARRRFAVFHFNLQCHLVVINKDGTRDRQEAVCQKMTKGRERLPFPPRETGSNEWHTGVFFQVQVPEPLEASSSLEILRVSSHNSLGLPRGLENVSAPITPHLHALPYVCRTMTDGMRPGQDTGDKDGKEMSQFSRPNSSHSGYGESMSLLFSGSRRSEHFQASDSIYCFL